MASWWNNVTMPYSRRNALTLLILNMRDYVEGKYIKNRLYHVIVRAPQIHFSYDVKSVAGLSIKAVNTLQSVIHLNGNSLQLKRKS